MLLEINNIHPHSFVTVSLLKANVSINIFEIIRVSEKYFVSSITLDKDNFKILGYELIRADHPSNSKRGGVCVY